MVHLKTVQGARLRLGMETAQQTISHIVGTSLWLQRVNQMTRLRHRTRALRPSQLGPLTIVCHGPGSTPTLWVSILYEGHLGQVLTNAIVAQFSLWLALSSSLLDRTTVLPEDPRPLSPLIDLYRLVE